MRKYRQGSYDDSFCSPCPHSKCSWSPLGRCVTSALRSSPWPCRKASRISTLNRSLHGTFSRKSCAHRRQGTTNPWPRCDQRTLASQHLQPAYRYDDASANVRSWADLSESGNACCRPPTQDIRERRLAIQGDILSPKTLGVAKTILWSGRALVCTPPGSQTTRATGQSACRPA